MVTVNNRIITQRNANNWPQRNIWGQGRSASQWNNKLKKKLFRQHLVLKCTDKITTPSEKHDQLDICFLGTQKDNCSDNLI